MKKREPACLEREMEQLTTEQLDELLQKELQKELPDETVVLPILETLRQREKDHPVEVNDHVANAWETYQSRIAALNVQKSGKKRKNIVRWVAAAAAVFAVLIACPFVVDADGTKDFLYRVKNGVVEFFRPGDQGDDAAYVYRFETADPELQKVYDAVMALGITEPMVPMWIPEDYVLEELKTSDAPNRKIIHAIFQNGENAIIIQITGTDTSAVMQYEQENGMAAYDTPYRTYAIVKNRDHVSAMWHTENAAGMINVTEGKETLYDILDSIYRGE